MRFVKLFENEILDTQTDLIWMKRSWDNNPFLTYNEAVEYASEFSLETGVNWRLPTSLELLSLVDHSIAYPATQLPLLPKSNKVALLRFWSSTPCVAFRELFWAVGFDSGDLTVVDTASRWEVLLVRE